MRIDILWPTFALVAIIYAVWGVMFVKRFGHIRRNPPQPADFADGDAAMRYFRPVEMPANNFRNLFEMPVLFFALVPLLMLTRHAGHVQVILAWIYVLLRGVHSLIHVGPNKVMPRFMVYFASCIVLSIMWIGFVIDMASVAAID
jgi:hypothetical protein